MKKVLLDTNAYCALARGTQEILDIVSSADTVLMSLFVIGELLAGFKNGSRERENRKLLDEFLKASTVIVLHTTLDTAEHFAALKNALKKAGTPVPINDVWIGAHALETGAQVITADSHFNHMHGISIRTYSA